ncbi:MAG TPA: M42 family metallopeptidase [Aggregatilineales bacterium]|nr:M42 family metallopeptidase [Aggregatilineales bacterium]
MNNPNLAIDTGAVTGFLVGLLNIPSPTGCTDEAIAYVQDALQSATVPNLSVSLTPKGALLAQFKGTQNQLPRAVTAHVDTLGLMVKEIKPNGRLKLTQLGSFFWNAIEFEGVTVQTRANKRYRGTVVPVNASYHVNRTLGEIERTENVLELRLDECVQSSEETQTLGISVGDFVFLDPRVEIGDAGFIRSRHLDDKAGVAAIYGAILALRQAGLQPAQDTTFLITNYEEVGHGVTHLSPDLDELLVVDMGAVGDGQASDEFSVSVCTKDASGPYDQRMTTRLRQQAEESQIPCRADIYPYYSSDGSMYWKAGGRARVGLIGPGVDASHGYERTHKDSIAHTAKLIACYLLGDAT